MAKKVDAYCIKCRKTVTMSSLKEGTMRGRKSYTGTCPECKGPVMVYKDDWNYLNAEKKECPKCKSELLADVEICKYCTFDFEEKTVDKKEKSKKM